MLCALRVFAFHFYWCEHIRVSRCMHSLLGRVFNQRCWLNRRVRCIVTFSAFDYDTSAAVSPVVHMCWQSDMRAGSLWGKLLLCNVFDCCWQRSLLDVSRYSLSDSQQILNYSDPHDVQLYAWFSWSNRAHILMMCTSGAFSITWETHRNFFKLLYWENYGLLADQQAASTSALPHRNTQCVYT